MFNVNIVDDTSVKSVESSKVGDEAVDLRLSMTDSSSAMEYYYLRVVGRKVLWSSACVCLCVCVSVCLCALFCPQDISRTGSWITTIVRANAFVILLNAFGT